MRLRPIAAAALALVLACHRGGDLQSPDPADRAEAVRRAVSGGKADFATLLVAQRDGSAEVRRAAAEAFAAREGPAAVDALAALLSDLDPEVASVAARGLAARPADARARDALLSAYAAAPPQSRIAIARALEEVGTSLREAVEKEARALWERNLSALALAQGPARAGAAEELGASARADAVTRLAPLLDPAKSPDPVLAAAAARGLGEAGDWSVRHKIEALLTEGDATLAEAAAAALARLGDPAAADALAAAANDSPGRIADAAVAALEVLPEAPEVGTALCELALRTGDPALAARAARGARLREAECPVKPALGRLSGPGGAAAAAAIAELLADGGEDTEAAVQKLVAALDPVRNADPALRAAAARALARLAPASAAGPVRERLASLRAKLAEARARWIPGTLPAMPAAGFGGDAGARLAAVATRAPGPRPGGSAAPPPGTPFVVAGGPSAEELGALAEAAGALRVPEAQGWLLELAADPVPAIRAGALAGLGRIGGEGAAAPLATGLSAADRAVREAAAQGLARLGKRGVPALAEAANGARGDPEWLMSLARALGETGTPEAIAPLTALLDGPAAGPSAAALGRLNAPAGPLVAALSRAGPGVQVVIIQALAQLSAAEAAPVLTDRLCADRPEVRAAAAHALGKLRYEGASHRLEALRSDYYGRVRRAAVEALSKLPTGATRPHP